MVHCTNYRNGKSRRNYAYLHSLYSDFNDNGQKKVAEFFCEISFFMRVSVPQLSTGVDLACIKWLQVTARAPTATLAKSSLIWWKFGDYYQGDSVVSVSALRGIAIAAQIKQNSFYRYLVKLPEF